MTHLDVVIVAFIAFWTLVTIGTVVSKLLLFFMKAELPWIRKLTPYYEEVLSWHSAIKSHDVFSLLATWTFFSNVGGWYDLYIYVRGFSTDCTFTEWKNVTPENRAGTVKLLYPSKCESRSIRSIASFLASQPNLGSLLPDKPDRESSQADESSAFNPIIRQIRYQFLLRYVRLQPFGPAVERCQFLIATSKADVPPLQGVTTPPDFTVPNRNVLFVSPFHELNPQDALPSGSNTDSTNVDGKKKTLLEKQAVPSSVNERYAVAY